MTGTTSQGGTTWKPPSDNCTQLTGPPSVLSEVVTCNCVRNPGGHTESNPRPSEEGASFYHVITSVSVSGCEGISQQRVVANACVWTCAQVNQPSGCEGISQHEVQELSRIADPGEPKQPHMATYEHS